jgi:hypothetical protein
MIAIAAGYAVQLMLVPKLLHEQHFESSPTAMETFWMRGAAVPMTALAHCLKELPTKRAVKVAFWYCLAIGIFFSWNAKFGYLTKTDKRKPFHAVPEVLFALLSVVGGIAAYGNGGAPKSSM